MTTLIAAIVTIILFCIGIIGIIMPLLPGPIIIWLGMLFYGAVTGFNGLTFGFYLVQGVAAVLVMLIDYFTAAYGTRHFGGSRQAMWGAVIGLIIAVISLGPAGLIFGPFLGAFAAELVKGISLEKAIRSSFGAIVGLFGGILLKIIIEGILILWFFFRIIT